MKRRAAEEKPTLRKFDFEQMKSEATHESASVRKRSFMEYFERFHEFPSYLFDNDRAIDEKLRQTIDDILNDPAITKEMKKGIDTLLQRLPA